MELYTERATIFKYRFYQKRFIFNDADGNCYFIQLEPNEFGFDIEVIGFDAKLQPMSSDKVILLAKFLQRRDIAFFQQLTNRELTLPHMIHERLSERFIRMFLKEKDREFIFRDKDAKHWIIDFASIAKGQWCIVQPKLFPWHIQEVNVTLLEDGRLFKDVKEIDEEHFWRLYDAYLASLKPKIAQKDSICRQIEMDLQKRSETLSVTNAADVEKEARVDVLDTWFCYEPLLRVHYPAFDHDKCSLQLYGIDMEVSYLLWRVVDAFGLEAIEHELYYWSEVEVISQKFFTL